MRAKEWGYINKTIGLRNNNTKPFWNYVKSRRQESTGVAHLKKGTSLQSDGVTKAHILLDQFKSVSTPNDGTPLPKMKGAPFPTLDQLTLDANGVAKLLKILNPAKASGPDGIPNMILETCVGATAPALTCIIDVPYRQANYQRIGCQQTSQQSSRREKETKQKTTGQFP